MISMWKKLCCVRTFFWKFKIKIEKLTRNPTQNLTMENISQADISQQIGINVKMCVCVCVSVVVIQLNKFDVWLCTYMFEQMI